MKPIRSFLAVGLLAAAPSLTAGQIAPGPVSTGAGYEWYRFRQPDAAGLESLSLLTIPYGSALPVGGGVRLEIGGAYARSVLVRRNGAKTEVEGITDTQLRLRLPLAGDRVVLGAFAVLPTGISTATQEEVEVAGAIASDLLPLRVSHCGSGGAAGLQLTVAHMMGRTGVGMGVSYLVSRAFDPLEEAGLAAYRPGDQLAA
jgi:hypothetical protein